MLTWLAKVLAAWFIRHQWGKRCKSIVLGCANCNAWLMYDYLFSNNWFKGDTKRIPVDIIVPASTIIHTVDEN